MFILSFTFRHIYPTVDSSNNLRSSYTSLPPLPSSAVFCGNIEFTLFRHEMEANWHHHVKDHQDNRGNTEFQDCLHFHQPVKNHYFCKCQQTLIHYRQDIGVQDFIFCQWTMLKSTIEIEKGLIWNTFMVAPVVVVGIIIYHFYHLLTYVMSHDRETIPLLVNIEGRFETKSLTLLSR